jgi:hypothetical protein
MIRSKKGVNYLELHIFFAFVIATTIMIALPGPSVILTVAHSISFGWQRALATVAGATMGIAVQLTFATVGLSSLLHFYPNSLMQPVRLDFSLRLLYLHSWLSPLRLHLFGPWLQETSEFFCEVGEHPNPFSEQQVD